MAQEFVIASSIPWVTRDFNDCALWEPEKNVTANYSSHYMQLTHYIFHFV